MSEGRVEKEKHHVSDAHLRVNSISLETWSGRKTRTRRKRDEETMDNGHQKGAIRNTKSKMQSLRGERTDSGQR